MQLSLFAAQPAPLAALTEAADPLLSSYDFVAVAFSGGKDSLAVVCHLLNLGVPKEKIELHH